MRNFNALSSGTQKLFTKNFFWVLLKCTTVSDIYKHVQNWKSSWLHSCFSWKRPFLTTKYHTRLKIIHNLVKTYFDQMTSSWKLMISSYFCRKIGLDFWHDPCWSCFCLNSALKEQVLKVLLTFSQNYSIIKYKVKNKVKI